MVKGKKKIRRCKCCFVKTSDYIKVEGETYCSKQCLDRMKIIHQKAPYAGKHLVTPRGSYKHHGIGDLNGGVIHYSGFSRNAESGPVCKTTLRHFAAGKGFKVVKHPGRKFSIVESVERAESRLGEEVYNLSSNNCEHFVFWSIEGKQVSVQVDYVVKVITGTCFILVATASLELFAVAGRWGVVRKGSMFSWLQEVEYGSGLLFVLSMFGLTGALCIATGLHLSVLKNTPGISIRDALFRKVGRYGAYITAVLSSLLGLFIMYHKAERIQYFMWEGIEPEVLSRVVMRVILYSTGGPALLTAVVGYGLYKLCWYISRHHELKEVDISRTGKINVQNN